MNHLSQYTHTTRQLLKKIFSSQRGIVLITGLIFLIILTLLASAAMNSALFAEKMTYNARDATNAFEAAQSALGEGEAWLENQTAAPKPVSSCSAPPCAVWADNILGNLALSSAAWWQSQGTSFSATLSGVYAQPRYIIEFYSFVPYELSPDAISQGKGYYFYRVTSRGNGISNYSSAIVQSIYSTQFN